MSISKYFSAARNGIKVISRGTAERDSLGQKLGAAASRAAGLIFIFKLHCTLLQP